MRQSVPVLAGPWSCAVGDAQHPAGPARYRSNHHQQGLGDAFQEPHAVVQAHDQGFVGEVYEAEHAGPGGGLLKGQAPRPPGQGQTQQIGPRSQFAWALDRFGLVGENVRSRPGGSRARTSGIRYIETGDACCSISPK